MIRLLLFLIVLSLVATIVFFLKHSGGEVVIELAHYRIETSMVFLVLATIALFIVFAWLVHMLIWLKNYPLHQGKLYIIKKKEAGLNALLEGFAALAAEDAIHARKLSRIASRKLGKAPLVDLLEAQLAVLQQDSNKAKIHYTAMLQHKNTRLAAMKGLLIQAHQEKQFDKAVVLAEEALTISPNASWALITLSAIYKKTHNWQKAEQISYLAAEKKLLTKEQLKHELAIFAYARSRENLKRENKKEALALAKRACQLQPCFVVFSVYYAEQLLAWGKKARAVALLEKAWKFFPYPGISKLYQKIFSDEKPEKQLKKAERLLKIHPQAVEGHLYVAKLALSQRHFSKARNHLKFALNSYETAEICTLMADIERQEQNDETVVNQWLRRAEFSNPIPKWICQHCNNAQNDWSPNCHHCQAFDQLQWQEPSHSIDVIDDNDLLTRSSLLPITTEK